MQRYEYSVETIRSSMVGDKIDAGAVEKELNERAREGWQLKSLTATQVKGRIGPGDGPGPSSPAAWTHATRRRPSVLPMRWPI